MAKREIQPINAGSMADIAFLLLIFFLVTTTMDTDSGITRMLPPIPEDDQPPPDVRERNIFVVLINANDQLLVRGELTDIRDLREKTKEFLLNPEDKPNLPEKREQEVPYFGNVMVHRGVISLRNDRGTSYQQYIQVQNELVAAGNELKNQIAMERFGRRMDDLEDDERRAVNQVMPVMISEAEPRSTRSIGGTN